MRYVVLALVVALGIGVWARSGQDAPPGVTNYTRVDSSVACGGATAVEAYPALAGDGFKAVINLRQSSERGADVDTSRAAAEAAGLRYIHIPVDGGDPQNESVDRFLDALRDPANTPVYIHCASANRVGAFWLVKRVMLDGWSTDEAIAEAERIGLRSAGLKQFALSYLESRGKA